MRTAAPFLLTCVMAILVTASPASAAVRSVQIDDGIDDQDPKPSLVARDPTIEVVSAHVDYDERGTVTASVTYNFAPGGSGRTYVNLDGAAKCADAVSGSGGPPELAIRLSTSADDGTGPRSSVTLAGYDSFVSAPTQVSADGLTVSATFSHPAFAGRDYRCANGYDASGASHGDDLFGYFARYEPQSLTPKDVTAAMNAELAERYGATWTAGEGKWSTCPKEEVWEDDPEDGIEGLGLCEFRFKDGAKWRHGGITFKLVDGYLTPAYFGSSTFSKTLKRCHIRRNLKSYNPQVLNRSLRADGYVSCGDGPMLGDFPYLKPGVRRVGFHGTNRAGFEAAVTFRCVIKARSGGRRSASCANRLGDRFIYRYTLRGA